MNRWAEFGFPQIHGVPLCTLLEGLYLACAERFKVMGWYDSYDPGEDDFSSYDHMFTTKGYEDLFFSGKPIGRVVSIIEQMVTGLQEPDLGPTYRSTPDFKRLSPETLAAALGQELVPPPVYLENHANWVNPPLWNVTYEWIRQRYEMLNISATAISDINSIPGVVWHAGLWDTEGSKTEEEAYAAEEALVEETVEE